MIFAGHGLFADVVTTPFHGQPSGLLLHVEPALLHTSNTHCGTKLHAKSSVYDRWTVEAVVRAGYPKQASIYDR